MHSLVGRRGSFVRYDYHGSGMREGRCCLITARSRADAMCMTPAFWGPVWCNNITRDLWGTSLYGWESWGEERKTKAITVY